MNKSSSMKTTLKYLLLVIGAGLTAAAFAGLVGIASPVVFKGSAIALSVFAAVGMLLIGATDTTRRQLVTASTPPFPTPAVAERAPSRRSRAYGIRRRARVTI